MIQLQILVSTLMLIFLLSSLSGCGSDSNRAQKKISDKKIDLNIIEDRISLDPSAPQSLALLILSTKKGTATCTGFLVSPDTLITNSHCVENINKTNCHDDFLAVVQTDFGSENRRCQKVIFHSKTSSSFSKPDYAVVKLNAPIELDAYLKISRSPINHGEAMIIDSFNLEVENSETPDLRVYGSHARTRCYADYTSMHNILPRSQSAQSPITLGMASTPTYPSAECYVIGGNSGSPVFNASGAVIGTAFAAPAKEDVRKKYGNFALVTNFSCLKFQISALDQNIDPSCDTKNFKFVSSPLVKTLDEL